MVVYMDGLLIFGKVKEFHPKHIEIFLSHVKDKYLFISLKKCESMRTEISFLDSIMEKVESKLIQQKSKFWILNRSWKRLQKVEFFGIASVILSIY